MAEVRKPRVILTIDDQALEHPERLLKSLETMAFEIEEVLEFTGNVIGCWRGELEPLRALEGVLEAEYEGEMYPQQQGPSGEAAH